MRINFWSEDLKGRGHAKELGVDGRIILDRSWGNGVGGCRLD